MEISLRSISRFNTVLDPFPYAGGITTCDSLWMGVPVITLRGNTAVGRGCRRILANIGLSELIANNEQEYWERGSILPTICLAWLRCVPVDFFNRLPIGSSVLVEK